MIWTILAASALPSLAVIVVASLRFAERVIRSTAPAEPERSERTTAADEAARLRRKKLLLQKRPLLEKRILQAVAGGYSCLRQDAERELERVDRELLVIERAESATNAIATGMQNATGVQDAAGMQNAAGNRGLGYTASGRPRPGPGRDGYP